MNNVTNNVNDSSKCHNILPGNLAPERESNLKSGENTKKILFVCIENAGRSQMAEAFARYYGKGKILATSAGNRPADKVNPLVVEAMKEKGIDISMNKPKLITFEMAQDADLIVTMGLQRPGNMSGTVLQAYC
jgi:hypothetical protein